MVYALSLLIYLLILITGVYLIKKNPHRVERYAAKIALLGFGAQIFINWAALGNIPVMPQISALNVGRHGHLDFMILSLISIFCYAALLVILYKTHDYYHDNKNN